MIVVYQREPGEKTYESLAKWHNGEWITGAEEMSHLPDEYQREHILDHFSGGGTRIVVEFENEEEIPEKIKTESPDNTTTVELDGSNWMAKGRADNTTEQDTPEAIDKPLFEMTEEEIRRFYSEEAAEQIIAQLNAENIDQDN